MHHLSLTHAIGRTPRNYTDEVHSTVAQLRERWDMTGKREERRRDPVGQMQMAI